MSEPSFRKFTPQVRRGITYAIAALEFDSRHDLIDPERGGPLGGATRSEDLKAAELWLRYEIGKRE